MVSTADIFKSLSSQSFLVVQAVEEEADKTIQPQRATGDSTYNLQKRPLSTADLFKKYSITDEAEDIGGREEVHGQEEDDLELVHIHEPEIVKTTRIYDRVSWAQPANLLNLFHLTQTPPFHNNSSYPSTARMKEMAKIFLQSQ